MKTLWLKNIIATSYYLQFHMRILLSDGKQAELLQVRQMLKAFIANSEIIRQRFYIL